MITELSFLCELFLYKITKAGGSSVRFITSIRSLLLEDTNRGVYIWLFIA